MPPPPQTSVLHGPWMNVAATTNVRTQQFPPGMASAHPHLAAQFQSRCAVSSTSHPVGPLPASSSIVGPAFNGCVLPTSHSQQGSAGAPSAGRPSGYPSTAAFVEHAMRTRTPNIDNLFGTAGHDIPAASVTGADTVKARKRRRASADATADPAQNKGESEKRKEQGKARAATCRWRQQKIEELSATVKKQLKVIAKLRRVLDSEKASKAKLETTANEMNESNKKLRTDLVSEQELVADLRRRLAANAPRLSASARPHDEPVSLYKFIGSCTIAPLCDAFVIR
ncbi:hypothetical protein AAVH_20293 [Aphelenchoides avenae]|nr:hypothetical protein AAVH_20293 [Aphelenchus avenae]